MITPKNKAETLNQQFQSVFTKKIIFLTYFPAIILTSIDNLNFSVNGIQKLLQELKHGKAPSPDNIATYLDPSNMLS